MGNLFGRRPPKSKLTEQDSAVLQLKQQRDKLEQHRRKVEGNLLKDKQCAVELLRKGKKDRAKLLLRKKKFQEQMILRTSEQLDNIKRLISDIEFTQIELQVVEGLKVGNNCLKQMHQLMSLEDVERLMDETQEAVEYQHQIDQIISGGLTREDESDVLKELEQLIEEEKDSSNVVLPEVPSNALPKKATEKTKAKTEALLAE